MKKYDPELESGGLDEANLDITNFLQSKKIEIENQKKLWWNVHKEDHEICERLQLGRASPVSIKGGVLSPHWEKSVRAFQKHVIKSVMKSSKINKEKIYV